MPTLRSFFASSAVLLLAACGASKGPKPVNPDDVKGPETPDDLGDLPKPPGIAGPVDLTLTCHDPQTCSRSNGYVYDTPDYTMELHADRVACQNLNGTFQLNVTSADGTDSIHVSLPGYSAPGQYSLNQADVSYIDIAADGMMPVCRNGALTDETNPEGLRAKAPDPSCGAGSCTIDVSDADPSAPYPKRIQFRVRCDKVCKSGTEYTCAPANNGTIDFTVAGVCEDHQ